MGCFGKKNKKFQCSVVLLDETDIIENFDESTKGQEVLDKVYRHLNLLETAYFGLRYLNKSGESRWLDPLLKISKQLKGTYPVTFYFGVKFYASDPCKLLEEITRYQFVLQLKQDVLQGRLPVVEDVAAELFALSLQSELGDYDPRKHQKDYVSEFRFLPDQSPELELKVEQIHKTLVGQVPSTVEMTFLEKVKWLDMYGVDLHPVTGDDQVEYFICLTPSGVAVMKNKVKISNYFWPRISKVFFKGRYFMLRVRDKSNDETTYGFGLATKEACEYLWKCSVEHHAFFRLTQVKDLSGNSMQIFRLGSKYRYSGRTEQQMRSDAQRVQRAPPPIVRVPSRRFRKRLGEPDGADADIVEKEVFKKSIISDTKDDLALPHLVPSAPLYRSVSTPAVLAAVEQQATSTEIAPWENPNQRGLFSSRHSIASSRGSERHRSHHKRSSSIDSHNSNDSTRRRRHHHRSKRSSDNESDISKSSRGSRSSKNGSSHRRSRTHSHESGSDSETHHRRRGRRHSRRNGSNYNLIDSEPQWKIIQRQQEQDNSRLQSAVVRDLSNRKSGYMNSGIDTESEATMLHRKKHRRHSRSRSRSPESKPVISQEVKNHIDYHLIDSTNLTEEERKDIKYTKIETNSASKIRFSPASGRPKYKAAKVSSRTSLDQISRKNVAEDDPPPPYTPIYMNENTTQIKKKNVSHESNRIPPALSTTHVKEISRSSSHRGSDGSSKSNGQREKKTRYLIQTTLSSDSQETIKTHDRMRHQRRKKHDYITKPTRNSHEISTEL